MNREFENNVYQRNPHISRKYTDFLSSAIQSVLKDESLARQVLRPEDFNEWKDYVDHGYPITRNTCSITSLLFSQILKDRAYVAYGLVTDTDPFTGKPRTGDHYRLLVATLPDGSFVETDEGNKQTPLDAANHPLHTAWVDASYSQFTKGAKFTLYRFRSYDQFRAPIHEDLLKRTAILFEAIKTQI